MRSPPRPPAPPRRAPRPGGVGLPRPALGTAVTPSGRELSGTPAAGSRLTRARSSVVPGPAVPRSRAPTPQWRLRAGISRQGCPRGAVLGGGERSRVGKQIPSASTRPSRALASDRHPHATRSRPRPGRGVFGRPPSQGRIPKALGSSRKHPPPILGAWSGRGARASISGRQGGAEGRGLLRSPEPGGGEVAERAPLELP